MDATAFIRLVTDYLDQLLETIEASYWQVVDCELSAGVLNIYTNNRGTFIINRNIPRQELWLSSPLSGGAHFTYADKKWLNTRTNESFEALLFSELDQLTS
jgi:frataxin